MCAPFKNIYSTAGAAVAFFAFALGLFSLALFAVVIILVIFLEVQAIEQAQKVPLA